MEKICPKIDTCDSWTPSCGMDYVYCSLRDDIKYDESGIIIFDYEDRGEHGFIDIESLTKQFKKEVIK